LAGRRRLLRQGADTVKVSGRATKVAGQDTVPADVEQTELTLLAKKTQDKRALLTHPWALSGLAEQQHAVPA
jgi:hypothetical protein